ncbi:hypothetical protein L2E82_14705 [Cichorium intybus]|uniref:Uncharacterized protein n=1 Tax=Cichorium intybus TaxID=13427 RepID=A0ACB9F0T0_CICIN|nr:hypothetical protein L2E82_14705 [Cichorium intybus]
MKIGRVPQLLSSFTKVVAFFSFSDHNKKLLLLFLKYTYEIILSCVLLKFLALSFLIVVAIFLSSTKLSNDSEDSHFHSLPFLSILEIYPLSYKAGEEILDETYSFTNNVDEIYSLSNTVAEDNEEFIPRIVHLELIEGATESHGDYKDSIPGSAHVELIEGAIRVDDEGDKDDVDSTADDKNVADDLKIRIEEFIAKNIKKWKEEMLVDKIRYLEY